MNKATHISCLAFRLAALFLLLPILSNAQQRADRLFKTYSAKDGLANNSIYYIEQAKNGLLWISTPSGLHRFDGYNFEQWNKAADSSYQTNLRIFFTKEDSESNLWAFTHEAPYVFKKKEKVYRKILPGKLDSVKLSSLRPLFESNGRIWCLQYNFGLVGLNKETITVDSSIDLSDQLTFLGQQFSHILLYPAEDESGVTWMAGSYGDSNFIISVSKNLKTSIQKNAVREFGVLKAFIPTGNNEFLFISTTQTFISEKSTPTRSIKLLSKENIPGNYTRSFCFERLKVYNKGNIIFPGNDGIWEYNPTTKVLSPYSISFFYNKPISRQLVFSIKEDNNGNIWVGRDAANGLLVYYPQKLRFNLLESPTQYFNLVYSLAVDEDENLYAANYEKGINVFDKDGRFNRHIPLPLTEYSLPVSARCMAFINKDNLLLKSLYGLLMHLDLKTSRLQDISTLIPPHVKSIPLPFDANIVRTGSGSLVFFINKYLLEFIQSTEGYQVKLIDSIPASDPISAIAIGPDGTYTLSAGHHLFNKKNGNWEKLSVSVSGTIKQINFDPSGNLWVASSEGIHKLDKNNNHNWYTQANGLADDFIYGILFDDQGNAWFSSNKGLGCIQTTGKISTYSEDDGVQGEEFDTQSFCVGKSGKLYFGGVKGITSFFPKEILGDPISGSVLLTGLSVNGLEYKPGDRLESYTSIQLPYSKNALTFSFSLNDFSDPNSNTYQVKMESLDKDWSSIKNIHSLRYNLQPGEYTLKIKGSSDGSTWSEVYQLAITIHPAWWQTLSFRIGLVLLLLTSIVAAVLFYNRNRRKKLLQVQKELQKERERISRDLHDNIGAYTSALISHIDGLKRKIPEAIGLEKNIDPIKEDAHQILGSLRETIWILKHEEMRLTEFSDGFKQYANKLLKNLDRCTIEFNEDIVKNRVLSPSQALNLYRILQEALQNTIKHANASHIDFQITDKEKISISYRDNGIGFDSEKYIAGNGIDNMQHRAEEAGFDLLMETQESKGVLIRIVEK